jgi:hypothetical protein
VVGNIRKYIVLYANWRIDKSDRQAYYKNMPERSSKKGYPEDINILAARIVEEGTIDSDGKNLAAVLLGRLGGKKGGKARAEKLTPEQRSEIARKAAQARWQKLADSQQ